jgi:hypothetical protein
MFVFYRGGVNIKFNNQPDDDIKNGQQERTTTSRKQRQRGKENRGEVGCAAMNRNRRGGFMFSECCVLK